MSRRGLRERLREKFNSAKRTVQISSTLGMLGYGLSYFIPIVPQVVVVVVSFVGGAIIASRTGNNNSNQ